MSLSSAADVAGSRGVARRLVHATASIVVLAFGLGLGACGQSMDTPLPDLSTKNATPSGQKTLTPAEQKRAIDDMIAKRDGKAPQAQ